MLRTKVFLLLSFDSLSALEYKKWLRPASPNYLQAISLIENMQFINNFDPAYYNPFLWQAF
jgi:hypothetical protein